jgi:pimeloyl-ACP methyl ester carboxylesterase
VSTVLLLHAGIADNTMWKPQLDALAAAGHRVVAPDLRGFGERRLEPTPFSHLRDAEALLDGPAAVVGNSLGGRVALELAVHRPELVERLVLIAPGMPGWQWSDETRAAWAAEEEAYESGDLDAAAEAAVRLWVDGPNRSPDDVDPSVRVQATRMVLRSYEMQRGAWEGGAEEAVLEPPVADRLGEIRCPTLVLVGDHDVPDMKAIAAHVADSIEAAQLVRVPNAAHLPSLERQDEVNRLLLAFLSR